MGCQVSKDLAASGAAPAAERDVVAQQRPVADATKATEALRGPDVEADEPPAEDPIDATDADDASVLSEEAGAAAGAPPEEEEEAAPPSEASLRDDEAAAAAPDAPEEEEDDDDEDAACSSGPVEEEKFALEDLDFTIDETAPEEDEAENEAAPEAPEDAGAEAAEAADGPVEEEKVAPEEEEEIEDAEDAGGPVEEKFALEDLDFTIDGTSSSDDDCVHFEADYCEDAAVDDHREDAAVDVDVVSHGPTLSGDEARKAEEIEAAYADFFEHISFRKGWKACPFRKRDVDVLFHKAAVAVSCIRSRELDGDSLTLRQTDGSARDWMMDAHDPVLNPRAFVDGLVHATFLDGNGYVEGLTEQRVDELLDDFVDWSDAAFSRGSLGLPAAGAPPPPP